MKLKHLILLSVSGSIISLDQLTKHLIIQKFFLGQSITLLPGLFNLTYIRNPGAAFGLFSRWSPAFRVPFFIIVPIAALVVIAYIFRKVGDRDLFLSSALSLVIGGAIGNFIDRVAYNYVVDFLDFHWGSLGPHFPAFNVADTAICVGVGMLMLDILRKESRQKKAA